MPRLARAKPHRPILPKLLPAAAVGTTYTLTAPSPASGAISVASQNFTVAPTGSITGTITMHDGGAGGTFTPTTLTFSSSAVAQTFTYTPASVGAITISTTNNNSLTDPGSVSYTSIRVVAATYYWRADGNDSNTGLVDSSGGAWLTGTKAASGPTGGYIAGDTLTIDGAGGTITDTLIWGTSGTQAARCTIGGINTATIHCGNGTGIKVLDAEFVTVQNLTIAGSGVSSSDGTTTSTGYGILFFDDRTAGNQWRDSRILNCTISGTQSGIGFKTPTPDTSPASVVGFRGITVKSCTVHDIQQNAIITLGGTVWLQAPPYYTTTNTGVFLGVYVGYCTVYNVFGSAGVYDRTMWLIGCIGGVVERTVVHNCGLRQTGLSDNAQIMWEVSSYCLIQYCEAYDNFAGSVLDLDLNTDHCVIQYCYTHENDGAGLMDYGSGSGATNVIRHCVSRNDTGNQDGAPFRIANAGQYYGNTIISDANIVVPGTCPLVLIQGNAILINNILVGTNGLKLISIDIGKTPIITGNLYYTGNPTTANFDGSLTTLAAWRSAGYETAAGVNYGVIGDPLLSSPTSGANTCTLPSAQVGTITYFDIASNSPARGAGVPPEMIDLTFGVTNYHGYPWYTGDSVDFHGYPWRTGAAVDIGAVAYGASSLVPGFGGGSSGINRAALPSGVSAMG